MAPARKGVPGLKGRPALKRSVARCRTLAWQAAGISGLVNLLMLTGPIFMLQVYDRVLASRSEETLFTLFALVVALFAFYGLFEFLRGRLMARAGARIQTDLDADAFKAAIASPGNRNLDGQSRHALRDLEHIQQLLSGPAAMAILDLPWSPLFFAVIFLFHWQLGVLAIGGASVLVVLAVVNAVISSPRTAAARREAGEAERFERSCAIGAEAVQGLGMTGAVTARWRDARDRALTSQIGAADGTGAFGSASKALRFVLQSAILAWGAWLAIGELISPGMIIAASIMMGRALAPIDQMIAHWHGYVRARLAWRNLCAVLEDEESARDFTSLPALRGHLAAQRLDIVLPQTRAYLLRGLSFEIEPGQALGILGPTGSGKSVLARALVGLWPAIQGSLTIDGAALEQWDPEALGSQIGYLPQEVSLLNVSVGANISRLADPRDDDAVIAAAKQAGAHELILSLADGYDTMVEGPGGSLSGGHRQRIGLARALYGDPALVVLDEPNAHLDADGEKAVIDAIRSVTSAGRTVVVMVHRPSAIVACDLLLVLANGRQQAFGPCDRVLGEVSRRVPAPAG